MWFFTALAIFCATAALFGYHHQAIPAALCAIMAYALHIDNRQYRKPCSSRR